MEWSWRKIKINKKIPNNLNPVSKTSEHKGALIIPADRELFNYFYLLFYPAYFELVRDYLFSLHRAAYKAIYVYIVDSFTLFK